MPSILSAAHVASPSTPFHESLAGKITFTVAASAFVALCAHVSIPLPFTPVPLTLQPFAVILVGMVLGPVAGFAAMMLYLAEGALGLPVFTPQGPGGLAQLLGATAGFLFSYPLAAAMAGAVVRLQTIHRLRFATATLAGFAATVIIFTLGAGWLSHLLRLDARATLSLAVLPFLPGEAIKIVSAAGIFTAIAHLRRA